MARNPEQGAAGLAPLRIEWIREGTPEHRNDLVPKMISSLPANRSLSRNRENTPHTARARS